MRDARRIYGAHLVLTLGGVGGALLAALIALDAVTRHDLSPIALCAKMTRPHLVGLPQVALLIALGLVAVLCGLRGVRALRREIGSYRRVSRVLRAAPAEELPCGARVVPGRRPAAFCFGLCWPRVYLTRSAVDQLGAAGLTAVLAHEAHHIRRRDPLRFAVARVMSDALFFLPMLHGLLDRYAEQAELAADEAFLRAGGDAGALASAVLVFESGGMGVHPDRVDQLLGEPAGTKVPIIAVAGGVLVLAALLVSAMAGASLIGHAPTLISSTH